MKRSNDNFWRRWFLLGATIFIVIFIILLFNLLSLPLNQKEPVSNENLCEYIDVSIGLSAKFAGGFMVYNLLIHILFDILFPLTARTIRIPFYEPRSNHWENQYLKEKKTARTILKNGILFVFGIPAALTIFTYITITLEGKTFVWNALSRLALKIVIRTGSRQSAVGSRGKSLRVIYNLLHSYIYLCPPTYLKCF